MALSKFLTVFLKDLEKKGQPFLTWLEHWLLSEHIAPSFPQSLLIEQLELHYHLKEQQALFHLSKNESSGYWLLHSQTELFESIAEDLFNAPEMSYCKGKETFFLATHSSALIDKMKSLYGTVKEVGLCSAQSCLGPAQYELVRNLPAQPIGTAADLTIQVRFIGMESSGASRFECRLVQPKNKYSLSMLVSLLENFGLQAQKNYFYEIPEKSSWEINSFSLISSESQTIINNLEQGVAIAALIEAAIMQVIQQRVENDPLHRLIITAGLNWRHIELFRAWLRYLWQIKCPISFSYGCELLIAYASLAQKILEFFEWRFLPSRNASSEQDIYLQKQEELINELDSISSADADMLLRKLVELCCATMRTNYYQRAADGSIKSWLSFKIAPHNLTDLPAPVMAHEVFVYSYHMEGIHLRSSDIARGGIRWSDRIEDYRTEVLGLAKAQQVKNSIIVPSGAKGAFIVRPQIQAPENLQEMVVFCYETFIKGLLDITDNRIQGEVVSPENVCCWDKPDPYLVVAADKGTTTFSDRANALAAEYGFWLGDAFASGGSQGYDHKKLGITAKGAFVSLRHHLRDRQIDPTKQSVRAVGIGDMSGDVFGNGALQIPEIKWVAAFNHRHIFLDPAPLSQSHQERQRLFLKGRGSWDDFNPELISEGGGVFSRQQKFITLSPQVQQLLGTTQSRMAPNALIAEILKLDVELLFNGGIGTYIKASAESDLDVSDRQNDGCRVSAEHLQCQIVIEGGNLGVTQQARIDFARKNKGRINTDTLDNSGGVDCSDHEVNIKILLQLAIDEGLLHASERGALLESLALPITEKVLSHNRRQNEIISLLEYGAPGDMLLHSQIIADLCQRGKLNRALEGLPSLKEIEQRLRSRKGLCRPELIILLAYIKLDLSERLEALDLEKILFKNQYLEDYFPEELRRLFGSILPRHALAQKIIICTLVNRFVDEVGVAFFYRMIAETQAPAEKIFSAYSWVRDILNFSQRTELIRALPLEVPALDRYHLNIQLQRLMYRCVRWVLKNFSEEEMTDARRRQLKDLLVAYIAHLNQLTDEELKKSAECPDSIEVVSQHVPAEIWHQLCFFTQLVPLFALSSWAPIEAQSWGYLFKQYELTAKILKLTQIYAAVNALTVASQWEAFARSELREKIEGYQVKITEKFYHNSMWVEESQSFLQFWNQQVEAYFSLPSREFVQSFVLINHLELLIRTR